MENKSYNVKETAEILGIHPQTVLSRIHDGELHGYQEGNDWRVTEQAIKNYREAKTKKLEIIRAMAVKKKVDIADINKAFDEVEMEYWPSGPNSPNSWNTSFGQFSFRIDKTGKKCWYITPPRKKGSDPKPAPIRVKSVLNPKTAYLALLGLLKQEAKKEFTIRYYPELAKEQGFVKDDPKKKRWTLGEMFEERFEKYLKPELAYSDYSPYRETEKKLCKMFMDEIDIYVLKDFISYCRGQKLIDFAHKGQKLTNHSINKRLAEISVAYNWAIGEGIYNIEKNPVVKAVYLPDEKKRREPATWEQIWLFVDTCLEEGYYYLIPPFFVILGTGMRRGEIVAMLKTDVDLENKQFIIKVEPQKLRKKGGKKVGKEKIININKFIYPYVVRAMDSGDDCPYLFNRWNHKQHCYENFDITTYFAEVTDKCGLRYKLTPHNLRHSFAYFLAEAEVPIEYVQFTLGHDNVLMTEYYSHLDKLKSRKSKRATDEMGQLMYEKEIEKNRVNLGKLAEHAKLLPERND